MSTRHATVCGLVTMSALEYEIDTTYIDTRGSKLFSPLPRYTCLHIKLKLTMDEIECSNTILATVIKDISTVSLKCILPEQAKFTIICA